jgi:hypothetical protein
MWVGILALAIGAQAWAAPAQILLIRHAEKPADAKDVNLSPAGYARAQALVGYFQTNPEVTQYGTPAAIYAMGRKDATTSARPIETVTPLAQALGLPVLHPYTKEDTQPLVAEILSKYDGQMVLICWEHDVIQTIASELGVTPAPPKWPGSRYDMTYRIDFSGSAVSSFAILFQMLMPGDSRVVPTGNEPDDIQIADFQNQVSIISQTP